MSVQLSNHTQSKAMHNMSEYHLPQYYQPYRVPYNFSLMTYMLQTSISKNVAKLLINPGNYNLTCINESNFGIK